MPEDKEEVYIERELERKIKKYLKDKEIIAIVGARQCGKTTLMKHIFKDLKNAKFISFDNREILRLFNKDITTFVKKYIENTSFLFIDEFQYAKEGGKQLKFIYDAYNTKIILSGSSVSELSIHSIKYLVGRVFVFTLTPLSFEEFLRYEDRALFEALNYKKFADITLELINKKLNDYLLYGGYPRVVIEEDYEKKKEILRNIYDTYLLKEVKEILQIAEDEKISSIIKATSLQVGGLINFNELSNLVGIDFYQLKKYIALLKKTFILLEAKPYFKNKRKELAKIPKVYFLDNGFRNIAINNFQEIENRTDRGALNENFVASELFKKELGLNFWRTKAGAEIDFVAEINNKLIPIEVKTTLNSPTYGKSMKNFIENYKSDKGFILSKDYFNRINLGKAEINFMPLFLIVRHL
jgi:predicted AAA+ superfamily ATPase